jgi:3'-phosphoadenosine 5'-phosphosulfate (PAPS) 3'-phosphatase
VLLRWDVSSNPKLSPFRYNAGMCKHCLVGVGAAEATLRLPPTGYREKIWDHVAGTHFVNEAGGRVTDLTGRELEFGALVPGANNAGEYTVVKPGRLATPH